MRILSILLIILVSISVFGQKKYDCYKSPEKLIIDGDVYTEYWKSVPWSDFFIDIEGDTMPSPYYQSRMKMLWDDQYLYVAAEMEEEHIWGYLDNRDDIIYRDNDFEVFIDPLGKAEKYFEIEINALGTILDLYMSKPYKKGGVADLSWNADGIKKAVKIYGSINDTSSRDLKWTVEIAIPWTAYNTRVEEISSPNNGDEWRINFSRVQWETDYYDDRYKRRTDNSGKRLPENNWVWSPQGVINMHVPEKWGKVKFIDSIAPFNEKIWTEKGYPKFWVWRGGGPDISDQEIEQILRKLDDAGIKGFLLSSNVDLLNKVLCKAKQYNIKVHAWMWTMNRGDSKPEWLSYNQLGKSLAEEKAYVNYYKFMCPALPEVKEFIKSKMDELAEVEGLEGIHMDYIRYVDVILPIGLQPKYGLVQDHIMPEYDYGYHPYMRKLFEEKYGVDILDIEDPGNNQKWIEFRLNQLNQTIDEIRDHVVKKDLKITAAVFPTPDMSAAMVRQDWRNWKLDCYFPMVYHNFYNEDINWIRKVIEEDRQQIGEDAGLFCGLYLPSLQKEKELTMAINAAFDGGADGVSFFSYGGLKENVIRQIKEFTK